MPATRIALLSWLLSVSFSALYLSKFLGHLYNFLLATILNVELLETWNSQNIQYFWWKQT